MHYLSNFLTIALTTYIYLYLCNLTGILTWKSLLGCWFHFESCFVFVSWYSWCWWSRPQWRECSQRCQKAKRNLVERLRWCRWRYPLQSSEMKMYLLSIFMTLKNNNISKFIIHKELSNFWSNKVKRLTLAVIKTNYLSVVIKTQPY